MRKPSAAGSLMPPTHSSGKQLNLGSKSREITTGVRVIVQAQMQTLDSLKNFANQESEARNRENYKRPGTSEN